MKRMLSLIVALACLFAFSAPSLAALPEMWLYSPALDAMNYLEGEEFEEGYREFYMSQDALAFVDILTLEATDYGMVGEASFEDYLEVYVEGDMAEVTEVACDGIGSYPARRIRFETGANEDLNVVDATAIWTEGKTFVYIVTMKADAWYGFMDGYEDGAAEAMVDAWLSEIQIEGYDADEWDGAQTLAVLAADFSCGMTDAEDTIVRTEVDIEGEFDVIALAAALSEWTGLDFIVDYYYEGENGVTVVWQPGSTLVAGLDDREQKEEFFFYDAVSLNWFMMDSLYLTIQENLGIEEVYYTMEGPSELAPTELGILESIPMDIPYMGSAFYFAHDDVTGEEYEEELDYEDNDYGFFNEYLDTEFFRVGIPDAWQGLYEYGITWQEPFGYTITFWEKEGGFVFSLEARWFDDTVAQLDSLWQGYLGRMNVDKLGELDLIATFSQPAPDAGENWNIMYDACFEVVDTLIMQEGVTLEMGAFVEYEP